MNVTEREPADPERDEPDDLQVVLGRMYRIEQDFAARVEQIEVRLAAVEAELEESRRAVAFLTVARDHLARAPEAKPKAPANKGKVDGETLKAELRSVLFDALSTWKSQHPDGE